MIITAHVCGCRPQPRAHHPPSCWRESYREAGQDQEPKPSPTCPAGPPARIEQLRAGAAPATKKLLARRRGGGNCPRPLPHGHVLAALGTARPHRARRTAAGAGRRNDGPARSGAGPDRRPVCSSRRPKAGRPRGMLEPPPLPAIRGARCWGSARVAAKEVYATLDWLGREQPFHRSHIGPPPPAGWRALLLYDVTLHPPPSRGQALSRRALLRTGAAWATARDHRGDRPARLSLA